MPVDSPSEVRPVFTLSTGEDMMLVHEELLGEFHVFAKTAPSAEALMERIAHGLHEKMTRYNWVGFYLIDPADPAALIIGPYVGSFTPKARITINSGLCGAAATSGQTVVVDDVALDPRYLAGSSMVNSEMVVPIFAKNKFIAELDIDSHFAGTFAKAEQVFVEACAHIVGKYLEHK